MQEAACRLALKKGGLERGQIQYLFAGDLLGQLIATSFGVADLEIPLFGLYGPAPPSGGPVSGGHDGGGGVRGAGAHRVLQPFCHGGETVPVSPGLREPETLVLHLDGDRERRLRAGVGEAAGEKRGPAGGEEGPCGGEEGLPGVRTKGKARGKGGDLRRHGGKDRGHGGQGLHEHGGGHGPGGLQHHLPEFYGSGGGSGGLRQDHHRGSGAGGESGPPGLYEGRRQGSVRGPHGLRSGDLRLRRPGHPMRGEAAAAARR